VGPVNISLDQAIEIHARVLMHRLNDKAPFCARRRAVALRQLGDDEGHAVWLSVSETAERLLIEVEKLQKASR
jgi:hypothetical protein